MASVRNTVKPAMAQTDDGDDYWNTSSFKPFNFNEDDYEEDSIEKIQWDGTPATTTTSIKSKSAQQKATLQRPSSAAAAVSRSAPRGGTSVRYQSARRTNQFPPSPAAFPSSSASAVDVPRSQTKNDTRTITEVVSAHGGVNATTMAKLESENSSLHRQLKQAQKLSAAAPSRDETLSRIMVGNPYMLELYKSKQDKAALLDGALKRHDGNAIVAITLFMRDTLKRDIFSKELMNRPVAVDHYCSYLRDADEIDELHETLSALGRTEEAAMLKYRQCLATTAASTPKIRANGLKDCVKYYFDSDIRLSNETNAISEQIWLMERQSIIEDADCKAAESGHVAVFKSHPRKEPIIYKSVVDTLYYCCYYHWGEGEGLLSSPLSIRKEHKIGEKQFQYIAIAALCRMRRWRDLENLLTIPKSLFRSARLQSAMGFDKVVDVLSKNHAPNDAISKYCAEIDNTERRLELAQKHNCYKVAIDAFVSMRDRQRMIAYSDKIPAGNDYLRQYLSNQARSQEIKWKN